ncbi:hypothetical protein AB0C77_28690 [Streptomyces sp. NPDC048629]|uniref:hypothetical protein n=1 Tax=Streptomyces sp. NPDC048629 TaxID=3154824 RepID=UPI0034486631
MAVETVLSLVLKANGGTCGCEGICGKEHPQGRCGKPNQFGKPKLIAAPYPPRSTDVENVAAAVEELRPWCGPCWRQAVQQTQQRVAAVRRKELEEAQLGLFDVEGPDAA